jgi:hypothetical protein
MTSNRQPRKGNLTVAIRFLSAARAKLSSPISEKQRLAAFSLLDTQYRTRIADVRPHIANGGDATSPWEDQPELSIGHQTPN